MNTRRFNFAFSVSDEFAAKSPHAARWIEARKAQIAKIKSARGPGGGLYRLVGPPEGWTTAQMGYDFMRGDTSYVTHRPGRYVPPSRVTPDLLLGDGFTLDSFDIPVVEGQATLPDGRTVETTSGWIAVPVPPATGWRP